MNRTAKPLVGLLYSGGLDSAILLGHLAGQGKRVQPLYIQSDLVWQGAELAAAERFLATFSAAEAAPLKVLHVPLADIYQGHWSLTGAGAPDANSPDEAVYLPGRNPLLLVKAAVWCHLQQIEEIALAPLRANPFPDATDTFFAAFEQMMSMALASPLRISRPFAKLEKRAVLELGRALPLQWTFSCIAPRDGQHCGECNKCAERQAAFRAAGLADFTLYAQHAARGAERSQ
ncbi:MAG TPA: 7-cyano-7-deazaguanine synthase [Pirellulales bacterium]|jgi:7-cyano-7-deazaguanine synthase|nr:7-cyano-7-deazaguanine synthase [Pirellulales bacterium]